MKWWELGSGNGSGSEYIFFFEKSGAIHARNQSKIDGV